MNRAVNSRKRIFVSLGIIAAMVFLTIVAYAQPVKINESTPLDQVKSEAAKGNADAMLELGERMIQGKDIQPNAQDGLKWLQKAANAGKHEAWYDMGMVYSNGMGVTTDMEKALTFYREGARLGDANCQCSLGLFYQAGEKIPGGVKTDLAAAEKWYRLAAEQNHTEAILHTAMLCLNTPQENPRVTEAAEWFLKGATLGDPEAQWSLGQCYFSGKGVTKDLVKAYALYSAASDGVENPPQKKGMSERRDKVGKELSAQQLNEANEMSKEWKNKQKH